MKGNEVACPYALIGARNFFELAFAQRAGDASARGIESTIIEHMKTPPTTQTLRTLIASMGLPVRELLRQNGTPYAVLKLDQPRWTDDDLLEAMLQHPILINRPIVVAALGPKLCRPSEAVREILPVPMPAAFTKEDGGLVTDDGRRRGATDLPSRVDKRTS